jgi:penicillin-binding protein 2
VLHVIVAALLIGLGGRVWYLQVMTGTAYASLARQDQVRKVIVPPVRGQILDDVGSPLVKNRSSLVVSVDMAVVSRQPHHGAAELRKLARLLGMRGATMLHKVRLCTAGVPRPCWSGSPYQPIPVDEHVSSRLAVQVLESRREFPGVRAQVQPVISYPARTAAAAAQVLGYLQPITPQEVRQRHLTVTGFSGVDLVGQSGLEEQYDRQLRGRPGSQEVAVNAAGEVTSTIRQSRPRAGDTLVTSINARVQQDTARALAAAIHRTRAAGNPGASTGAAVVMTTTGRVIAMASYPTYNPRIWTGGISRRAFSRLFGSRDSEPILNRATQGQYAPGSTWKVTSAAAAVAAYSLAGPYACPGAVTIGAAFSTTTRRQFGRYEPAPGAGGFLRHRFLRARLRYVAERPQERQYGDQRARSVQKMQKMELAWGLAGTRGRPARREHRHRSDTVLALLLLPAVQELLVQERPGQRQLRAADRIRRLPLG